MPGGGGPVGGSILEKDDGGGTNIPGTSERKGPVQGLRERYSGGIIGVTQDDAALTGGRGAVELGSLGHGRRAADVPDGLPDQGRAAELPAHYASPCVMPMIPPPPISLNTCAGPFLSDVSGIWEPPPSSFSHIPPPTGSPRLAWTSYHSDCLHDIVPQAQPLKNERTSSIGSQY